MHKTMKTLLIWIFLMALGSKALAQFNQRQRQVEFTPDSVSTVTSRAAQIPAEFPGGMTKFYLFISKKVKYPRDAKRQNIEGRVYVEFVIDKDGKIPPDSVKVVRGLFESCDKEATRVIRISPKWIPGRMAETGEPVAQRMVIPIIFKR